jgi:hypothetical protein
LDYEHSKVDQVIFCLLKLGWKWAGATLAGERESKSDGGMMMDIGKARNPF